MNYLAVLIPVALAMGAVGLLAFLWSLRAGQYEDLDGAAERVLLDDEEDEGPPADPARDGTASTGACAGASGLLIGTGIFQSGCVDCDYKGQICLHNE